MKLYAELSRVRARQIIYDAAASATAIAFVLLGVVLYRLVAIAAALGEAVEDVGSAVGRVPGLRGVGSALTESGRLQQAAILDLALLVGLSVAVVGVMVVLLWYLPRRLAWIREATAAVRLREDPTALHVLAHRALTRRSLSRIVSAIPYPGAALTTGNDLALAGIELEALGLRAPQPAGDGSADLSNRSNP